MSRTSKTAHAVRLCWVIFLAITGNLAWADPVEHPHQIGNDWSRKPVFGRKRANLTGEFEVHSRAVAEIDLGTGVLAGFVGQDLILFANDHVFGFFNHKNQRGFLPVSQVVFHFDIVARYPKIDLAVLRGRLKTPQEFEKIQNDATTISLSAQDGEELVTFGYGNESGSRLTWTTDDDCRIFSCDGMLVNSTSGHLRQTLHGCDVSVGDSGGPLFSRRNGRLVGIQSAMGAKMTDWRYDSREIRSRYEQDFNSLANSGVLNTMVSMPVALTAFLLDERVPREIRDAIRSRIQP